MFTNTFIFWESSLGQSAHLWPQRHGSGGWPLLVEIPPPSSPYQRDGGWHLPNAVSPFLMTITAKKKKTFGVYKSALDCRLQENCLGLLWCKRWRDTGFVRCPWQSCISSCLTPDSPNKLLWNLPERAFLWIWRILEGWLLCFPSFYVFWRARFDLWLQTGTTTLTNLTFPAFVLIPLVVVTLSGCNSSYGGLADSITARHPPLLLLLSLHQYLGTEMLVLGSMCTTRFWESFTEVID